MAVMNVSSVWGASVEYTYTFGSNNTSSQTDTKDYFTLPTISSTADNYVVITNGVELNFTTTTSNATLKLTVQGDGNKVRNVNLDNSLIGQAPVKTSDAAEITATITSAGKHTISHEGGSVRYYKISVTEFTTSDDVQVTPSYKIGDTSLTEGTVTIDGAEYKIGAAITLAVGDYTVAYTDGEYKKYTGILSVSSANLTPEVVLTEQTVPTTFSATAEFRVDPAETSDNVTYTGTFKDAQHGIQNGTITVSNVTGAAKFIFGGCQWGNGTINITASDGTSSKTYSISNKTTACENSYSGTAIEHTQYVTWYFDYASSGLTAPVTLTLELNGYLPYLEAETVDYVPSNYKGTTIKVDPNATVDGAAGTFTSVAQAIEAIGAYPPTNESDRVTVEIAAGTYRGRIDVNSPYVTLKGMGSSASDVIIVDNANEANQYVENLYSSTFHGDTVAVYADGFIAEKLTIANDSELNIDTLKLDNTAAVYYTNSAKKEYSYAATDTLTEKNTGNGTAFSIGAATGITGTATLNDVRLLASRDTVYTGKTDADTAIVMTGCTIYGFQDVICGGGDLTLTNCTWDVNSGYGARFFAPMANSTYKSTNLTVVNSGATAQKSAFARAWGDGTSTVIIDGYTDAGTNIYDDGAAISDGNTSIYGFETKPIIGSADITNMLWLVRKNSADSFNTTLAEIDTDANVFQTPTLEEDNSAYRIIGQIKTSLVEKVSEVGFVLYGPTEGKVVLSDTKAYKDGDNYYSLIFANDNSANLTVTIKPYVVYNDYPIEGKVSDGNTSTYTFAAAAADTPVTE